MNKNEAKGLREELGLSQKQVAIILGVSEPAVRAYENGTRSVSEGYAKALSNLYNGLTLADGRVTTGEYRNWRKKGPADGSGK